MDFHVLTWCNSLLNFSSFELGVSVPLYNYLTNNLKELHIDSWDRILNMAPWKSKMFNHYGFQSHSMSYGARESTIHSGVSRDGETKSLLRNVSWILSSFVYTLFLNMEYVHKIQ